MSFPLTGVRILELGQIIAGTYGSQLLSDLGAEVIKIETPQGDLGRIPSVAPYKGLSALFLTFNRNKKSVVIDLKTDAGRQVFYDLVKVADVVIDNFRAGVLERLKIDYATLSKINPRLIQCSVTGFGGEGEYKDYPALDLVIQAISGHMAFTGEPGRPPARAGIPLADLSGGFFSAQGILAALYDRERTGKGRSVELSMFDAMLNLTSYIGTVWLTKGELPKPQGSAHEYSVPWQAFAASDGYLVIATRQEMFWQKLCAGDRRAGARRRPALRHQSGAGREPRDAGAATRSHLPHPHRRRLDGAPARGGSAGSTRQQSRRRLRRAAGRPARDDRLLRSPGGRRSAPARQPDQDVGHGRHPLPPRPARGRAYG